MNIKEEWKKKRFQFPSPLQADYWLVEKIQRLNERLDSVEKAVTDLQDKMEQKL